MLRLTGMLLLLSLLLVSCASREHGWERPTYIAELSDGEVKVVREEALKLWKFRAIQENLEECLGKFELIHAARPDNLEYLTYLTRGYYFLANAHLTNLDSKLLIFERAASYGEKALFTNPKFKAAILAGNDFEEAINGLSTLEAPALYWTAASLKIYPQFQKRVKAMIVKVEKLQPDYFYGAIPRALGFALVQDGELTKGRAQFEKALKMAPEFQGTRVMMAEFLWTQMEDKKAFRKTLKEVLESKDDPRLEYGPENALSKMKAQLLLKNEKELF